MVSSTRPINSQLKKYIYKYPEGQFLPFSHNFPPKQTGNKLFLKKNYLPSKRETKSIRQQTGANPTGKTKQSSQRTSFFIQTIIERSIDQRKQESKVENQGMTKQPTWQEGNFIRKITHGGCEVQENKRRKENRPHKQSVYQYVNFVAVICPVESKVLFKIKQSGFSHWIYSRNKRIENLFFFFFPGKS